MKSKFLDICKRTVACYKRDFILYDYSVVSIVHKLLIGPIGGLLMASVVISGFFNESGSLTLGSYTRSTYGIQLLTGFLLHSLLNNGLYGVSGKLLKDWTSGTLGMLFILPFRTIISFLGACTIEITRAFIIVIATTLLLYFFSPVSLKNIVLFLVILTPTVLFSFLLGIFRMLLVILYGVYSDFLDTLFSIFLFLGALYIPIELYPKKLRWLIEYNPIYNVKTALISSWLETEMPLQLLLNSILIPTLVALALLFLFTLWNWRLREASTGH